MFTYDEFVKTEEQCSSKDLYKLFKFDEDFLHEDCVTVYVYANSYILQLLKDGTYYLFTHDEVSVNKTDCLVKLFEVYKELE